MEVDTDCKTIWLWDDYIYEGDVLVFCVFIFMLSYYYISLNCLFSGFMIQILQFQ